MTKPDDLSAQSQHGQYSMTSDSGVGYCCVVGPTAAGKSALAMSIAQRRNLAIVSADSRQAYRHFDIGTGKPSLREQALVLHYGIDCVEPAERYSAHRWARDAKEWILDAQVKGLAPVIVGGTGLYIRALVNPFDSAPLLDSDRRKALSPYLEALDREDLMRWCRVLDPSRAHLGRTQLLRAIETALITGTRLSDYFVRRVADAEQTTAVAQVSSESHIQQHNARYLLVDPAAGLGEQIANRVRGMVRDGLFEEVKMLMSSIPEDAPAWNACGYREIREAVRGNITSDAAIEKTIIASRQYAKRQRTWFRHQLPKEHVTHIDPLEPDAVEQALEWWDRSWNALSMPEGGKTDRSSSPEERNAMERSL